MTCRAKRCAHATPRVFEAAARQTHCCGLMSVAARRRGQAQRPSQRRKFRGPVFIDTNCVYMYVKDMASETVFAAVAN